MFVTGGSRGIGRAIAEQFLASGATVIVSGQDPSQSWGSREKKLKYIPVNFLDAADMSRFWVHWSGVFGLIFLLIMLGGITRRQFIRSQMRFGQDCFC